MKESEIQRIAEKYFNKCADANPKTGLKEAFENAIREALEIQEASRRVSVNDKLPSVLDRVLIWHNTSLTPSWGMYMGEGDKWTLVSDDMSIIRNWTEGATNVKVTHWQPLPAKPSSDR